MREAPIYPRFLLGPDKLSPWPLGGPEAPEGSFSGLLGTTRDTIRDYSVLFGTIRQLFGLFGTIRDTIRDTRPKKQIRALFGLFGTIRDTIRDTRSKKTNSGTIRDAVRIFPLEAFEVRLEGLRGTGGRLEGFRPQARYRGAARRPRCG